MTVTKNIYWLLFIICWSSSGQSINFTASPIPNDSTNWNDTIGYNAALGYVFIPPGYEESWRGVAYGNGLYVAVGNSTNELNTVVTSPDGSDWTHRNSLGHAYNDVIFANGQFVAVGHYHNIDSGRSGIITSPDGINWTARESPIKSDYYGIAYGNGIYVAVCSASDSMAVSSDGINWTGHPQPLRNWRSVAFGNSVFVAVAVGDQEAGLDRVMTSPDGINWTIRNAVDSTDWESVTFGNNTFVAVASNGYNRVMTSSDGGESWAAVSVEMSRWRDVAFGDNLFVAVASSGDNKVMESSDGSTWIAQPGPAIESHWKCVSFDGTSSFIAVASAGVLKSMIDP